jgi:8-oxo-dGTP diphosphatase
VNRDPRGRTVTIAHFALVKKADVKGADDAAQAKWFPIDSVPALAFDHDMILRFALKALREKMHFQPVGFELLPEVFTMPQLQDLYESVLEVKFDRRNFASKMLKLGILNEIDDGTVRKGTRNPIKYSFNLENYNLMKTKGFRLEF